jgi:hypothetical protein
LKKKDSVADQCADPTQKLSIKIPCRMAERVETYAKETNNNITGVIIEAPDEFLRERKNRRE